MKHSQKNALEELGSKVACCSEYLNHDLISMRQLLPRALCSCTLMYPLMCVWLNTGLCGFSSCLIILGRSQCSAPKQVHANTWPNLSTLKWLTWSISSLDTVKSLAGENINVIRAITPCPLPFFSLQDSVLDGLEQRSS